MKVKELIKVLETLRQDEEILTCGEIYPFCEFAVEEITFLEKDKGLRTCYLIEPMEEEEEAEEEDQSKLD